ncbi:glycosyltransferase family 1 protein [Actinoallomurus vinaceus]|uniref:Glycosyltransferase family 1 protein n=1 Tax=Actinoallomurus vinaceus TaxID=1080074 RepID=A0ABP8U2Y6_9ACTN
MVTVLANPRASSGPEGACRWGLDGHGVHVAELATELGRQGHQVTIYARRQDPDEHDLLRLAPGVLVEEFTAGPVAPLPWQDVLLHVTVLGEQLARRWRQKRPEIIHAHSWMSSLASLVAEQGLRIPLVHTPHGPALLQRRDGEQAAAVLRRIRLERAIGRTVPATITTWTGQEDELIRLGVPRHRIDVAPGGVDTRAFSPHGGSYPRGERPRLLLLSRRAEQHGAVTAIQALTRIPGAELIIAGGPGTPDTDPQAHRLHLLAKQEAVADRVFFLGPIQRDRVPELMRSADLLLTLPRYTGFGRVPVEAMACGIPVIATGVGGHLDTVLDTVTGVHVLPDRPQEVARQIRGLLADPTRRLALGIAGADRARSRYAWTRIARQITTVYDRATQNP